MTDVLVEKSMATATQCEFCGIASCLSPAPRAPALHTQDASKALLRPHLFFAAHKLECIAVLDGTILGRCVRSRPCPSAAAFPTRSPFSNCLGVPPLFCTASFRTRRPSSSPILASNIQSNTPFPTQSQKIPPAKSGYLAIVSFWFRLPGCSPAVPIEGTL